MIFNSFSNTLDVNGYTCTYDALALNRLSTLTQNRVKFKLKYDYSSRLIKLEKYTGTTLDYTDRYVYDGWNLLATYRDGALVKFYAWGEDLSSTMTGAGGVGGLLVEDNEAGVFLPQYDGNGNIISYLDSDGEIAASYTYDPFGNILASSGDVADSFAFRFSTKLLLPFELYYYGYRFYNPKTKTWLTREPLGEQACINLHNFAFNNAINKWDYLGLDIADYVPGASTIKNTFFQSTTKGTNLWDYSCIRVSREECCFGEFPSHIATQNCANKIKNMATGYINDLLLPSAIKIAGDIVVATGGLIAGLFSGGFGFAITVLSIIDGYSGAIATKEITKKIKDTANEAIMLNCDCEKYKAGNKK